MPKQSGLLSGGLQNMVIKCIYTYAGLYKIKNYVFKNVSSAILIIKKVKYILKYLVKNVCDWPNINK